MSKEQFIFLLYWYNENFGRAAVLDPWRVKIMEIIYMSVANWNECQIMIKSRYIYVYMSLGASTKGSKHETH